MARHGFGIGWCIRVLVVAVVALLAGGISAAVPELTGEPVGTAAADPPRVCSGTTISGFLQDGSQHDQYTIYVPQGATLSFSGSVNVTQPDFGYQAVLEFSMNPGVNKEGAFPGQPGPFTSTWSDSFPAAPTGQDYLLDLHIGIVGHGDGYHLTLTTSTIGGPACPPAPLSAAETRGCNAAEVNAAAAHATCADPIDTATGNLHEDFTDLSIPGRGMPLDYTRSHNSDPKLVLPSGPLGYGWTDSYHMSVAVTNSTLATVTQETGAQVTFNLSGSSWVPAAPRIVATLVHNGDGSWTFTRRGMEIFTFNSFGRLTSQQDLSGAAASTPYATTLAYDGSGQLTTVTDPAGRTLTFAYWPTGTGSGKDGLLHTLTDSAGRTVTYDYTDSHSNLTDVVDAGGGHWQFTYNSDHRILTKREPRFYGDTTTSPSPVVEPPWDPRRLHTLEARMESCLHRDVLGSRRLVGTAMRRRPKRCGWCVSSAPSWAPSTGR